MTIDWTKPYTVGIKLCASGKGWETWRVTYNGNILGDSRGYDKAAAITEARAEVARNPKLATLDAKVQS